MSNPSPHSTLRFALGLILVVASASCSRCGSATGSEGPPLAPLGQAAAQALTDGPADLPPFAFGGGPWEWETRGIGGGGTFLAASVNPHDPNDMAISTDMGMAFRTVDLGRSWLGYHFESLRGGDRAILQWTSDPQVVFSIDDRGWEGAKPMRSLDGGHTWQPLTADPTENQAWWIAADPNRVDRVLLSNWATLFVSTDGGATFRTVHAADHEAGLYIAGVVWAGDRIIVGSATSMFVSEDGGETFAEQPYAGLPSNRVIGSLTGATEGGVTGATEGGVTGATEGGVTRLWAVMREAGQVWPGIRSNQNAHYRGVLTLDWGDDAWREIATDLDPAFLAYDVRAAANDIDTVYLGGGWDGSSTPDVFRSRDGGATFTSTFRTANNENISSGWCGFRGDLDYWWSGAPTTFAISPTDSNGLLMGDLGFVHVSVDGGTTWRQAYVHPDGQHPPGAPTPKSAAYRGVGLEDTSSWWLHWSTNGERTTLFAAFSDIRGIVSTDGGTHWSSSISAGLEQNSTYHVVENPASGRLYAATATLHDMYQSTHLTDAIIDEGDGAIMFSDDGGLTWSELIDLNEPVLWLALDPTAPGRLYASLADRREGGIWVTDAVDDPTVSWRQLPVPLRTEGHPYVVEVLADGTLVTSWSGRISPSETFTFSSGIFVSDDGGETWSDRSHSDMRRWTKDVVIDPNDPEQNTWYASVFSHWGAAPNEIGGVFRTRDRGRTWQRISDLYRAESVTIDPSDPDHMYVTTETQGLWETRNLSAESPTFAPVRTYPFEHPTRVFFNPSNPDEVWATSFGGGLRVWNRSTQALGVPVP